jgi:hypothetical protein
VIANIKTSLLGTRRMVRAAAFAIAGFAAAALPGATVAVVGVGASIAMTEIAVAGTKAIPGIGIRVKKSPGGNARASSTTTAANGSFRFTGLEPGNYDVTVGNNAPQRFVVGANGILAGTVTQDGTNPPRAKQGNRSAN